MRNAWEQIEVLYALDVVDDLLQRDVYGGGA
jgi:hypothetical protein